MIGEGGGLLGSPGALGGSSLVHVLVTPVVPANGKGLHCLLPSELLPEYLAHEVPK